MSDRLRLSDWIRARVSQAQQRQMLLGEMSRRQLANNVTCYTSTLVNKTVCVNGD